MNAAQTIGIYAENKSFISFKIAGDIESTCTIKNSFCILSSSDSWENDLSGEGSVSGWAGALVYIVFDM